MSQDYKFKFKEMLEGNPSKGQQEHLVAGEANAFYAGPGNTRNLCFVQLDGTRQFLNYAYMVGGEYSPQEEQIKLEFTTHTVILEGCHLSILFDGMLEQLPRQIFCVDSRYNSTIADDQPAVNAIKLINTAL